MAIRFYLLPIERVGNKRGPKYFRWFANPTGLDDPWAWYDYGSLDWGVLCSNITTQHHNALIANADVLAIPTVLDNNLNASAVTAARNWCEAASLPGNWITTADTYRGVLRVVTNVMRFMQTVDVDYSLHLNGINLNATVGSLSQVWRDRLQAAADSIGLDYSAVTGSTTLRQVLKGMADQMTSIPVQFGTLATL